MAFLVSANPWPATHSSAAFLSSIPAFFLVAFAFGLKPSPSSSSAAAARLSLAGSSGLSPELTLLRILEQGAVV